MSNGTFQGLDLEEGDELPLFTELPRRSVLGNLASGLTVPGSSGTKEVQTYQKTSALSI
jgi:hypothetical protein